MAWLAKVSESAYDGTTGAELTRLWLQGRIGLWRFINGPKGIAAFSVEKHRDRVLRIVFMTGEGLIKRYSEILKDLHEVKDFMKCDSIDCFASTPTMKRLYEKVGFKPVATVMRLQ